MSTFLPISTRNAIKNRVQQSSQKHGSQGQSFSLGGGTEEPNSNNEDATLKTKEDPEKSSNPFTKMSSGKSPPKQDSAVNEQAESEEEAYILAFDDVPPGSTYDDLASLNTPKTQVDRSNFHKQI